MIEVRTAQYQFSHGKTPAGFGIWFFRIGDETFYSTPKKYPNAVKDARRYAAVKGITEIEVLP